MLGRRHRNTTAQSAIIGTGRGSWTRRLSIGTPALTAHVSIRDLASIRPKGMAPGDTAHWLLYKFRKPLYDYDAEAEKVKGRAE